MATDEELQELARRAWPGVEVRVVEDTGSSVPVYRAAKVYGHPRAREALAAALRVLAGEPWVPAGNLRELAAGWRLEAESDWYHPDYAGATQRCADELEALIDFAQPPPATPDTPA